MSLSLGPDLPEVSRVAVFGLAKSGLATIRALLSRDVAVVAFPTPSGTNRIAGADEKALYYREPFSSKPGVKPFLPAPAEFPAAPADSCIPQRGVIELTAKTSATGQLVWDVPPGNWTIMRLGRTLTGQTTRPAPQPGLDRKSTRLNSSH